MLINLSNSGSRIVYMLHITLLISPKGCVFRPAFGCSLYTDYFDQLSGARHTWISCPIWSCHDNWINSTILYFQICMVQNMFRPFTGGSSWQLQPQPWLGPPSCSIWEKCRKWLQFKVSHGPKTKQPKEATQYDQIKMTKFDCVRWPNKEDQKL